MSARLSSMSNLGRYLTLLVGVDEYYRNYDLLLSRTTVMSTQKIGSVEERTHTSKSTGPKPAKYSLRESGLLLPSLFLGSATRDNIYLDPFLRTLVQLKRRWYVTPSFKIVFSFLSIVLCEEISSAMLRSPRRVIVYSPVCS